MKNKLKIGDKVLSHSVPRYGIVTDVVTRKDEEPLITVKFVKDRSFRDYKKPFVRKLSQYWLSITELEF